MDIELDATARQWRDRAFRFATEELIPWEIEAELHEGRLPAVVAGSGQTGIGRAASRAEDDDHESLAIPGTYHGAVYRHRPPRFD